MDQAYLLPADADFKKQKTETYLAVKDLLPFFNQCKAKHILVVFDGGAAGNFSLSRKKSTPNTQDATIETDCYPLIRSLEFTGRQYLSVTNPKEWDAPAFADRFEQALNQSASQGLLSFEELFFRLTKSPGPSMEYGTFEGHSKGGNFFFRRSGVCEMRGLEGDVRAPDSEDIAAPEMWVAPNEQRQTADKNAYKNALNLNTEAAYKDYRQQFPTGDYTPYTKVLRKLLDGESIIKLDETAWETALTKNNKAAFNKYLKDHPNGLHRLDAQAMLKRTKNSLGQNALSDNMIFIKGGTFLMGDDAMFYNEAPAQTLSVGDFYLCKYEVTVEEYKAFVEATGYITDAEKENKPWGFDAIQGSQALGRNWRKDNFGREAHKHSPVTHVSWFDAMEYCKWLSKKTGKTHRLPTEAEWEYAAGNGSKHTKYSWGTEERMTEKSENIADETARQVLDNSNIVSDYFDGNVFTAHVGSYAPNQLGLYDMGGNVSEWCLDKYAYHYLPKAVSESDFSPGSGIHTTRGGSWFARPKDCRVTNRHPLYNNKSSILYGFRVLREIE